MFFNSKKKEVSSPELKKRYDRPWHSLEIKDILEYLETSPEGLTTEQARKRLEIFGENRLPEGRRITIWRIILNQLINPLVFILILAAIASIAIGDYKDAIFIFIVVFINTTIGTYQEYSAEKSASALQKLLKIRAMVNRDGKRQGIPSEELVPGDIVYLESGVKVPADIRLIEVINLEVDESFLTGESTGVLKQTEILPDDVEISEITNIAFAGSTVMKGRGYGVIVATGAMTQVGKIAQTVSEAKSEKPPLIIRMEIFVKQISIIIVSISFLIAFILKMRGMDLASIFFAAVALVVSAIPEGLPVALTVALSVATRRMVKRNVIVRRLTSVESLGSCTVIASDKTGTLTINQQTAKKIVLPDGKTFSITGEGCSGKGEIIDETTQSMVNLNSTPMLKELVEIAVIANEASLTKTGDKWNYHGDAIDVALLGMA